MPEPRRDLDPEQQPPSREKRPDNPTPREQEDQIRFVSWDRALVASD